MIANDDNLIGVDPNWQKEQDRRAEQDRRRQHYADQARIAQLEAALRACITQNGDRCLKYGSDTPTLRARIAEINITAGVALADSPETP